MTFQEIAERARRDGHAFKFEPAADLIILLATACQALQDDLAAVKAELATLKENRAK